MVQSIGGSGGTTAIYAYPLDLNHPYTYSDWWLDEQRGQGSPGQGDGSGGDAV